MSVEIDPQELGFRRPFTVEVAQVLRIKNPNGSPVAFKVKTTAPKQYCVRPNSGRIEPGHDVEVSVLLQAMKQEPPADARCRDKFLVQSVAITGDKEFTNVQQIWDSVERSAIQEKKIRVTWLAPSEDGSLAVPSASTPVRRSLAPNGVEATPDAVPATYQSPSQDPTPARTAVPAPAELEASMSPIREIKQEPESAQKSPYEVASAVVTASASAVASAAGEGVDELKQQLAKAHDTIAVLKAKAAETTASASEGLRQRKPAAASDDDKSTVAASGKSAGSELAQATRQGTEGVPVKIVAILCMASFLLAYIFF